jgi:L-ascorbate metabolism protein UlaG (beta-lactamase superfamily)
MKYLKERFGRFTLRPQPISARGIFSVVVLSLLIFSGCVGAAEPETRSASAVEQPVQLKWLGNAGWQILFGKSVILIDPFLTRREASAGGEWKTDEEAVLNVIKGADYIFAGHSHADHIADIPFIAQRFGSKVIGSRTTTNIALTAGVDKTQLITVRGGETLNFDNFSVQVVESRHGALNRAGRRRQPRADEILQPWSGAITGKAFVEGGSYLYYFTFGKLRVLDQSTGNFIEEKLNGLHPEVAILAATGGYDFTEAIKILRPKTVIIHHHDNWRVPFAVGISKANRKRAQRVEDQVKAVDSNIKVIVPEYFETIPLD